jgi:flagellar basal body P-ring formation protein FlgA
MRFFRFLCFYTCAVLALCTARASEPLVVTLHETATVGTSVVTVGDVALISGGDAATRARIAAIDLAELKSRDASTVIGRKSVEYRLLLAGLSARTAGAERTTVAISRRAVTVEEVTATARAELLRQYPNADAVTIELAVPVVVKLPEVPARERVAITAKPHGKSGTTGRVQVDMTIAAGGETLLSFALHMNVQPAVQPAGASVPVQVVPPGQAGAPAGGSAFASNEILVRPRQRVEMQVNTGGLKVSAVGEAQQAGKLGQTILVQNVDSKKAISARVIGPGTVEVDLGGSR